jgi:Protein of unknown function (DUF1566)
VLKMISAQLPVQHVSQWARSVLSLFLLAPIGLVLHVAPVHAKPPGMNDTGATLCFVNGSATNECEGSDQDAALGRDAATKSDSDGRLGFSFVKVCNSGEVAGQGTCPSDPPWGVEPAQWGCTMDRVTGLTWEVKTDDMGLRDRHRLFSYYYPGSPDNPYVYAAQVNQGGGICGSHDWRIPTRIELVSLVDYGRSSGNAMDERWFPDLFPLNSNAHWTDSTFLSASTYWIVYFGTSGGIGRADKAEHRALRLVRGVSQGIEKKRFILSDDEALDLFTGLIWRRCLEGMSWTGKRCEGKEKRLSGVKAAEWARSEALSTGLRWRLPNIKELQSIIDDRRRLPASYTVPFGHYVSGNWVWSSTPNPYPECCVDSAWAVEFENGLNTTRYWDGGLAYYGAVRLVRDAVERDVGE